MLVSFLDPVLLHTFKQENASIKIRQNLKFCKHFKFFLLKLIETVLIFGKKPLLKTFMKWEGFTEIATFICST